MVAGVTVVRGDNKRHLALLQLHLSRLQRRNARRARHHRPVRLRRRVTQQPGDALATLVGRLHLHLHLHLLHVHVRRHLLLRCHLLHPLQPIHRSFLPRTLLQELLQLTLRIRLLLLLPVLLLVLDLLRLRLRLRLRLQLLPQGGGSREAWCCSSRKAATTLR